MSRPTCTKRRARAAAGLAIGFACIAAPAAAQASPVNLATVKPFVVLAGSTVTNTGPSVLNGELGVSPGTAIVGFGAPAVVNGATHDNDAVAAQAQSDLTTAYTVAAGQPVAPADDLSGTDLGNRTLKAGAYRYTSSAQLTGPVTLDAEGDPNAQFVFLIASALTTASASSVVLINGASPCNVYWQVGSSATIGSTTAFQGNLMALSSISVNNGASVIGRLLARNGAVTLINDVLDASVCGASTTTPPGSPGSPGSPGTPGTPGSPATPGTPGSPGTPGTPATPATPGTPKTKATPPGSRTRTPRGSSTITRTRNQACTDGFRARVVGHLIKRVVFSLDGKRVSSRGKSPFHVFVRASVGSHRVKARVTFKDTTRPRTYTLPYIACAAAVLRPTPGPARFTG